MSWDLGEDANGVPMAWYTPEGYARIKAWSEEYRESGQCDRDGAILAVYAANPAGVLAGALAREVWGSAAEGLGI